MQRPRRGVLVAAATAIAISLTPSASLALDGDPTTVTSEDGFLSLDIPAGAVPDGIDIGISLRPAEDAPSEVPAAVARPFYEITPTDVVFRQPVTVTRRIVFADIGVDPTALQGLPIAVTAVRDAAGDWSWLDGQIERYEYGGAEALLIGRLDRSGQLFPIGSGSLTLAPDEDMLGTVGEVFTLEAVLGVPPASASRSTAASAGTSDLDVLEPEDFSDFDFLGAQANSHLYRCLAAGTSHFDANYLITSMSDVHPTTMAAGLDGSDIVVHVHGDIDCRS